MAQKPDRRVLARGLSQLMSETSLSGTGPASQPEQTVPIERIRPNALQPRKDFEPALLQELAESIRRQGVLQPLIVRPSAQDGEYEIVAGERRWRAAQVVGLHRLPVIVRSLSDEEMLEIAIIENIQRANLNALEEAQAYRQLMEVHGHTQEMVAEALSKSRSHIANLLRLLTLPQEVQDMVRNGKLSPGHARALITSSDPVGLAALVVGKGLSVRATEDLARKIRVPKGGKEARNRVSEKDADTRALETDLSASLGMRVDIRHEPGGETGVISVRYGSLDELDALCQALSVVRRDLLAS